MKKLLLSFLVLIFISCSVNQNVSHTRKYIKFHQKQITKTHKKNDYIHINQNEYYNQ